MLRTVFRMFFLCAWISTSYAGLMSPMWYSQPAEEWEEALPIGNGRLAAMVFGRVGEERVQFNEESLWSGTPQDADNPKALEILPRIRQLLFEDNYQEAQSLTYANLLCKGDGERGGKAANGDFGCYQTFGDLFLTFPSENEIQNYRRELDLNTAIVRVSYSIGEANYTREYFVSAPDQVCVVHLSCDQPGKISFHARLSREEKASVTYEGADSLVMRGQLSPASGVKFIAKLHGSAQNGDMRTTDEELIVDQADSAVLVLAAGTNYKGKLHEEIVNAQILAAASKTIDQLKDAHRSDYQAYFQRASLDLDGPSFEAIPTDQRLQAVKGGALDPKLLAQYFQFGRYLLISSSRPGSLPANLQGKWAHLIQTPWNCDYHTNINLQMNYWAAEVANLADCHKPLFDFISSLQVPGGRTAKTHYNARGWVVHHVTNLWGFTSPAENPKWGLFPAAGGWLCQHLWDHYAFGQDRAFLESAYSIMKGSAEFYLDLLVEEPKHHWLVTCPSSSPENIFFAPDGQKYGICIGPSMDMEIIWDLFTHTSEAARILARDPEFAAQLDGARARLAPLQIGKHGQLQEWLEDFEEAEPGHRHISHLFALYPGHQISGSNTPELAQAARRTLERRLAHGGGHTGWSQAWLINFWARLKEAEKAHEFLNMLLSKSTYPNFFDSHPPFRPHVRPLFQIDGNFGATAGIAEMLLQSYEGEIDLLPALPSAWPKGEYRGFRARGNVEVDVSWEKGRIREARLRPFNTGDCVVRFPEGSHLLCTKSLGVFSPISDNVIRIHVQAGKEYILRFDDFLP